MDVEKVGRSIAYLRKRAGYTQKELADRIGISDKAVSKWERGQGLPEIGYLRKLSILLDTDSDSLLAGDVAHHRSEWIGVIILDKNSYGIGAGTVIYDKPLINFLLSYFMLVGIKDITIACYRTSDVEYIQNTLVTGEDYGIRITTVIGGVRAVYESIEHSEHKSQLEQKTIMMVYGRCMLYGVDQTRFFQKAMLERSHFTMLVLPMKIRKMSLTVDVDKRVVNENHGNAKKLRTQYDFSEIPIVFFPAVELKSISEAESIEDYIALRKEKGNIFVEMLDRGFVEIEIDTWENVHEASVFMKIVQDKCGMNVYCLEEVAWRRGMISLSKLRELGERKKGTEYGNYILGLYERHNQRVIEE